MRWGRRGVRGEARGVLEGCMDGRLLVRMLEGWRVGGKGIPRNSKASQPKPTPTLPHPPHPPTLPPTQTHPPTHPLTPSPPTKSSSTPHSPTPTPTHLVHGQSVDGDHQAGNGPTGGVEQRAVGEGAAHDGGAGGEGEDLGGGAAEARVGRRGLQGCLEKRYRMH